MKQHFFLIPCLLVTGLIAAQKEANPGMNELKEKVIGWAAMLPPIGNANSKSLTLHGYTYSASQLGLIDTFINWIKKSYIPIGGVPVAERLALPIWVERPQHTPKGTGVSMGMWAPCYDASGKKIIRAQPASASYITVLTNNLNGIEKSDFNTTTEFYFTMYYSKKGILVNEEDAKTDAPYVADLKSKVGNYFCYYVGKTCVVVLMPGNELPVVQLSKGEVLTKALEAAARLYPDKNEPTRREVETNVQKLRNKYQSSLNDPAFINHTQLSVYRFSSKDDDPFERLINTRYMFPVYKFTPSAYEESSKGKTLWVSIYFPHATEKSTTVAWEIYKAMTKNFNFEYVYNYFFNPDKVKGKSYQPLNAVTQAAALNTIDSRENKAAQSKIFPAGVHFMEDFADATSGSMPAGWSSTQKNRGFTIESLPGENGKWLMFDNSSDLIPSGMKTPMPQNFTMEYDLVSTDYTNRAGRMITLFFTNSNGGADANLYVTPGNEDNIRIYPSMAGMRVANAENASSHYMEFASYSNKKHKAYVKIVKKGTSIKAYVNGVQVEADPKYKQNYAKEMAIPENTAFTGFYWKADNVSAQEKKGSVYISNIKITKDQ
jgi:hypothetical protein